MPVEPLGNHVQPQNREFTELAKGIGTKRGARICHKQ